MSHPWMIQNFAGPLEIHMVPQEPLQADELEQDVICGMTGFEFGTEDDIENHLTDILLSEPYHHLAHQNVMLELIKHGWIINPTINFVIPTLTPIASSLQ